MQRIERFHLVELLGRQVALAEGRHAQIDKGVTHGCAAETATAGRPFAAPLCADQFVARRGAHGLPRPRIPGFNCPGLPIGSGLHAPRRLSLAPSQPGVELPHGDQVLDVVDTLVLAPFEVLELEVAVPVCLVELARPTSCIPLWLEFGDESSDLAEVSAVAPLVRSSLVRKFDPAAWHGLPYDLG